MSNGHKILDVLNDITDSLTRLSADMSNAAERAAKAAESRAEEEKKAAEAAKERAKEAEKAREDAKKARIEEQRDNLREQQRRRGILSRLGGNQERRVVGIDDRGRSVRESMGAVQRRNMLGMAVGGRAAGAGMAATGGAALKGMMGKMAGGAGPVGGILGFILQGLSENAQVRADTNKLINMMRSVEQVDSQIFDKMKQRHMAMKAIGAEGDLGSSLSAFARGAIGSEAVEAKTGINVRGPGGGNDVQAVAMAMNELGKMGAGTAESAIGDVLKNQAGDIAMVTTELANLQQRTQGTGIAFSQLLSGMTQVSGTLRMQAGDVGVLAEGYMTVRKSFADMYGDSPQTKRMISNVALQGFQGAMGAYANMSPGMAALVGQDVISGKLGQKLGLEDKGMGPLGVIASLKMGTLFGDGIGRDAQAMLGTGMMARQYNSIYSEGDTREDKIGKLAMAAFNGDHASAVAAFAIEEALTEFEEGKIDMKELEKRTRAANKPLESTMERRAKEQNQLTQALIRLQQGLMEIAVGSAMLLRGIIQGLYAVGMKIAHRGDFNLSEAWNDVIKPTLVGGTEIAAGGVGKVGRAISIGTREIMDQTSATSATVDDYLKTDEPQHVGSVGDYSEFGHEGDSAVSAPVLSAREKRIAAQKRRAELLEERARKQRAARVVQTNLQNARAAVKAGRETMKTVDGEVVSAIVYIRMHGKGQTGGRYTR